MSAIRSIVRQLRKKSRELRVSMRSSQISDKALLNSLVTANGKVSETVDHFRNRRYRAILGHLRNNPKTIKELRKVYPLEISTALRTAQNICNHRFHILGQNLFFRESINWHIVPEKSSSWPLIYWENIDFSSENRQGDIKYGWELSRHQYFHVLWQAYLCTENHKYIDEMRNQIESWIAANPFQIGINWIHSLDIGIRLISWTLAFPFLAQSRKIPSSFLVTFLKSLLQQAAYLAERTRLALKDEINNNHLIGKSAALAVVSLAFPEFKQSQNWFLLGSQTLQLELSRQVFPDGASQEQSTSYHRFVVDFLLLLAVMAKEKDVQLPKEIGIKLELMLEFIMHVTKPNGEVPMLGDSDDGRGFKLSTTTQFWDFRPSLALGAVLFDRTDMKFVSKSFPVDAFYLLGPKGLQAYKKMDNQKPAETSKLFPHAGHCVIRDDWSNHSNYFHMRAGKFGLGNPGPCVHSHCDLLSFVLSLRGKDLIIDSGTFTYNGDRNLRNNYRDTVSHNTIRIDGKSQASFRKSAFGWQNIPEAAIIRWEESDGCIIAQGQLKSNVSPTLPLFRRKVAYYAGGRRWNIKDTLVGDGFHEVEWFLHFAPQVECILSESACTIKYEGEKIAVLLIEDFDQIQIKKTNISYSYGCLTSIQTLSWNKSIRIEGKAKFGFSIHEQLIGV